MRASGDIGMTTVAYIANQFPSPLEPYVMDEVRQLRAYGTRVVCCSGKRVSPRELSLAERAFWKETRFFQPLSDDELLRGIRRLAKDRRKLWEVLRPLVWERDASSGLRVRALGHTAMGAVLAEQLAVLNVEHIHAHHGYFASWMALVAANLLGIGFSFTLHGSDLLQRADLLGPKLSACQFCMTVSEFNRQYILRNFPSVPAEKIVVRRLGVDRVLPWPTSEVKQGAAPPDERRRFHLLAVGRLHPVKNHQFLIEAAGQLREQGLNFICWIAGEGPERPNLEQQISRLGLQGNVSLIGQVPRGELSRYYQQADLVVMTSKSEGIPVALMEAMAHEKLVLAPAITGIPELVEHERTGFLYPAGCLPEFVNSVWSIYRNRNSTSEVGRAAAELVAAMYSRPRNLRAFAKQFLTLISKTDGNHANPILQQVRLSI